MSIRAATIEDHSAVSVLLLEANLLVDDLDPQLLNFFVTTDNNQIVGAGGLDIFGSTALLRSLVVAPETRGRKLGAKLTDRLCLHALTNKVKHLYLLTETAESFFTALGFERTPRNTAPADIQQTQQFSGLCPDSATLMVKHL